MKRSRIYVLLAIVVLSAWAGYTLYRNKQIIEEEARLSQLQPSFVPVSVVRPRMETLATTLETNGVFLPVKEMFVISETQGRVLEVFKGKGDWLKEGEAIAKVDDELLSIELEATQANLAKLRKDLERVGNLVEGEAVAKNKIEDIELGILAAEAKEKGLKKQIANTSIRAPMTGTLSLRFIERGSVIGPGIQVAQMTNLDKLNLVIQVTEREVLKLQKGQTVDVVPDVFPELTLSGKVTNIGVKADKAFNYPVEIEVPNSSRKRLRAGMHAKAIFHFDAGRQGITLPRKAIEGSLQDPKVYTVYQDTIARLQRIELGATLSDKVEVRSGLTSEDLVVITGQINLSDGSKVKVVGEELSQ